MSPNDHARVGSEGLETPLLCSQVRCAEVGWGVLYSGVSELYQDSGCVEREFLFLFS